MTATQNISVAVLAEEVGSLPSVAAHIVSLSSHPRCDMTELADVIITDAAMSLRFLALANSAAFSRGQEVRDLRTSLVRLGLARVRDLALLMGAHDLFPSGAVVPGLAAEDLWRHNLATACWARALSDGLGDHAGDAWLVGILQGLGLGVLMRRSAGELAAALEISARQESPLADACRQTCGVAPWEVGAAVCDRWQLPRSLCDAVAHQGNDAGMAPDPVQDLIRVVQTARNLARAQGLGSDGDGRPVPALAEAAAAAGLDPESLDQQAAAVAAEVDSLTRGMGKESDDCETVSCARASLTRLGLEGMDASLANRDLQQQLDTARGIQQNLLPAHHDVPGPWTVAAINRPSRVVSGDIYDILPAAENQTAVVVADVAGKGVAAALLASTLQATLRALAPVTDDPGELVTRINQQLCAATDDEHFATMFLMLLPETGGRIHYVSAGHVPPLVVQWGGGIRELRPGGPPVGMLPNAAYRVGSLELNPGDRMVVCTDGLTETADAAGNEFGMIGLTTALGLVDRTPERTLATVLDAVLAHADPVQGPADDLTLLVAGRDS